MHIYIVSTTLLKNKKHILNANFEFYIKKLLNSLFDRINCLGISDSRFYSIPEIWQVGWHSNFKKFQVKDLYFNLKLQSYTIKLSALQVYLMFGRRIWKQILTLYIITDFIVFADHFQIGFSEEKSFCQISQ